LCHSREEAEDLVQETFARVLRKPRVLRADDDVGYLLGVLRNTFLSGKRSAARRPRTTTLPDGFEAIEDPREQPPDTKLESHEVYGVIAALPALFRDALVAVDVAGLSYREAARSLGIREATLTTRLHRARQRVARELTSGLR
jgi:RNA polymerase sigma-70 factor (ECF subfamily)